MATNTLTARQKEAKELLQAAKTRLGQASRHGILFALNKEGRKKNVNKRTDLLVAAKRKQEGSLSR